MAHWLDVLLYNKKLNVEMSKNVADLHGLGEKPLF